VALSLSEKQNYNKQLFITDTQAELSIVVDDGRQLKPFFSCFAY
jgi:hypothetical protein